MCWSCFIISIIIIIPQRFPQGNVLVKVVDELYGTIVVNSITNAFFYLYSLYLMEFCFLTLREVCTLLMHNKK